MPTHWIATAAFFVVFLGIVYLIARYQLGHEAAFKRLPLMGGILVFAIAFGVVIRALPYDWGEKAWIGMLWVFPLLVLGLLFSRGRRERQAGPVLMALGRDRASLIGWLAACVVALMSFLEILSGTGDSLRLASEGAFWSAMGGYLLLVWYDGRQLREGGIVSYGVLFRWNKIQGYDWKGEVLSVWVNRRWPFSRVPVPVKIPPHRKNAVDQILRERVNTEP